MLDAFKELFCSTKTYIANPLVRTSQSKSGKSFLILDNGNFGEDEGYWVQDENARYESVLSMLEDVFWDYDPVQDTYESTNVAGRRLRERSSLAYACNRSRTVAMAAADTSEGKSNDPPPSASVKPMDTRKS